MTQLKSVNEVCKLSGVSRRTLQYYDEIGLLPPSTVKNSGYRQYDDESLHRLWYILFYKELGISLNDIHLILENPKELEKIILNQHKQILLEKQAQLQRMIHSVDLILNDKFDISMLRDFDKNRIETLKQTYENEIHELIESAFFLPLVRSGILSPNASVIKNASNIMTLDFSKIIMLSAEVVRKFCEAMKDSPESLSAKEAVATFKTLLEVWITVDNGTFRKIAEAYLKYKDYVNKKTPGLAEFVSATFQI